MSADRLEQALPAEAHIFVEQAIATMIDSIGAVHDGIMTLEQLGPARHNYALSAMGELAAAMLALFTERLGEYYPAGSVESIWMKAVTDVQTRAARQLNNCEGLRRETRQ